MKRHISIFTFLLGVFAAALPAAAMNICGQYYCKPDETEFTGPDTSETYIEPCNAIIYSGYNPVEVRAKPAAGWAIVSWHVANQSTPLGVLWSGEKITGVDGALSILRSYRSDTLVEYIGVKFSWLKYNVKYDKNGGAGESPEKSNVPYTDRFNLAAAPTLTGCTFGGWLATSVGKTFAAGASVGGADLCPATWHGDGSNVTMVAQWTTNAYAIAYELDGGSSTGGPDSAQYGKVFEVSHPNKAGWQFKGWKVVKGLDSKTAKWGSEATGVNSSIASADMLCKGNGASTFFLNISAAKDGKVTLQAVWTAVGYTVTFDNQGADSGRGGISSMTVNYGDKPGDLAGGEIPFKTGNDFTGYYEGQGGTGEQHWNKRGVYQFPSWPYTEGRVLYAGWNAHHYSVSYAGLEDATGYPTSAAYGEIFSLTRPAKAGYKFAGWNVVEGLASKDAKWGESEDRVDNSISYSWTDIKPNDKNPTGTVYIMNLNTNDNAQVTLKANWDRVKYKATFEIAGANNNPTKEVEVTYDDALPNVTTVPTYESGEIFRGYFTEPNGQGERYWNANGTPAKEKWTVAGDLKLYECKTGFDYYITYDANGGEGSVPQQSCNSSNDVTLASGEELHRSGFRLCGWDFNRDHSSEEYAFQPSQTVSASDLKVKKDGDTATLFAIWQDKHVGITIDATGGTAYTNGVKVTSLTYVDGEKYGFLPTAERPHYVFRGWFTQEKGGERILEDSIVDYGSVQILYAQWTPERFFVAFDGNGATNADAMAVQEFAWDEEKALSQNLYGRTGYTFDGWATNAVTMKKVFDDCQVLCNLVGTADATQTVFAVWHTNSYTVVFNPNGAKTGEMEPQDFFYDQPQALSDCGFSRSELWSFAGWTNSAAGGPLYTNRETVVNLCAEDGGVVTLDAVWTSDIGELSEAMGCDNLKWESNSLLPGQWIRGTTDWSTAEKTVSCAWSVPGDKYAQMQTKNALTNGTLRFWWKSTGGTQSVWLRFGSNYGVIVLEETDGQWREVVTNLSFSGEIETNYIQIQHQGGMSGDACYIANMTWTPEGSDKKPEYVDFDSPVKDFSMTDGYLGFSFEGDGISTYHLLGTNDLVAPMPWPMVFEIGKPSGPFSFEIPVKEDEPKMFYRIRALK